MLINIALNKGGRVPEFTRGTLYIAASCSPAPFPLIAGEHEARIHERDPPSYIAALCSPALNFKTKCHAKSTIIPCLPQPPIWPIIHNYTTLTKMILLLSLPYHVTKFTFWFKGRKSETGKKNWKYRKSSCSCSSKVNPNQTNVLRQK